MGYDSSRFNDEIETVLNCSICSMVMEDPVQTPCIPYSHSFCKECINTWITVNASCPIDRNPLAATDLKPSRDIRDVLAEKKMKCEFQLEGCESVFKLEHLKVHLESCEYNPNAEITCDKGCNLKMKRSEYKANNCYAHIADRVILNLTHELSMQKEDFQRALKRQEEEFKHVLIQQEEYTRKLNDEMSHLQQKIEKLNLSVTQIKIKNRPLKWGKMKGMKITGNELNVLEGNGKNCFAQLCDALHSSNSSFEVQCLQKSATGHIQIMLFPPSTERAIMYRNDGVFLTKVGAKEIESSVVATFDVGDTIECRIDNKSIMLFDGRIDTTVCFYRNAEIIKKVIFKDFNDILFIRFQMSGSNKIKCLTCFL